MKPSILLCGAGRWGRNYERLLAQSGLAFGVCDESQGAIDSLTGAALPGRLLTTTRLTDLLKTDQGRAFDAVIIATPADTHYELALAAIEAGRHVLVEKPMAMDYRAAAHLVEAAEERGVKLQVGHLFELNPGVRYLQREIGQGRMGDVEYVFSHQLSPGRVRAKEDVILSLAPHDVSIILALAGAPSEVTAIGAEYAQPDVAGMAVVHMAWEHSDKKAHLHVSWLHPEKVRRVVVLGSRMAAVLDDRKQLVEFYERGRGENPFPTRSIHEYSYRGAEPLKLQLDAFVGYVEHGVEPPTMGHRSLFAMAVLDAARRSLLSGSKPTRVSYGE